MQIVSRPKWGARRPRGRTRQNPRLIHEFFLHYPASPHDLDHIDLNQEQRQYMRQIQAFHMDVRGWADFAYNFAVFQDGKVYRGRGLSHVPAAQGGRNTNTIAVLCVVGNTERPSIEMKQAIKRLKNHCDKECGRDLTAKPHSAVNATSCPGNALRGWIDNLNRRA